MHVFHVEIFIIKKVFLKAVLCEGRCISLKIMWSGCIITFNVKKSTRVNNLFILYHMCKTYMYQGRI